MSKNLIQYANVPIGNGGKQTTECFFAFAANLPRINAPIIPYANVPIFICTLYIRLPNRYFVLKNVFVTCFVLVLRT
jgi:hypothetical protein